MGRPGRILWIAISGMLVAACGSENSAAPPIEPTAANDAPTDDVAAQPPAAGKGFRPVTNLTGTFEGTVWIDGPVGDKIGVAVTARVGPSGTLGGDWDLYFNDPTQTLSADGLLSLKSGAARWLSRNEAGSTVQAEVISLGRDVLRSPGWSVLAHPLSGEVKGEAWLRVPSSGADLPPFRLTFFLRPTSLPDCAATCSGARSCDHLSGFCTAKPFAPGEFRGDLELSASHEALNEWTYGPAVSPSLDAANVWCANEAFGFRGQWSAPGMGTMARPVMPHSGDLFCLDPANPYSGARAHGPIPLANRADFEELGMLAPMDPDRLAHLCVGELERRPPLGFANRFGEESAAFRAFRDGYLNYEADCVSMGHFAALVHVAQQGIFSTENPEKAQLSRRALSRLLQQWIQLHAFVATKHSGLSPQERLARMESGWTVVLALLGTSSLEYIIDPAQADYREGLRFGLCRDGCGDPALRCETSQEACASGSCRATQCVLRTNGSTAPTGPAQGLTTSLMEGLTAHMNLVTEQLNASSIDAETYGRSMRFALLVETLTNRLVQLATHCEPNGALGCAQPAWLPSYEQARDVYIGTRTQAAAALAKGLRAPQRLIPSLTDGQALKPL